MITQPPVQLEQHILDAFFRLLRDPRSLWLIAATAFGIFAPWVRKLKRYKKARSARSWLSISASVDVVSVAERQDDEKRYYVAVLTYFYKHPALQIGEYEREFSEKVKAQNWVEQFKGRQVMVRVNPEDPAESILFDSDLGGLEICRPL